MRSSGTLRAPPAGPRIHLHRPATLTAVRAVKRRAGIAYGEILVEYDHYGVLGSHARLGERPKP